MKPRCNASGRGAVAIEMALVLLQCFVLLPTALYCARVALHSAVMQQAAHGAARYLSSLPPEVMRNADNQAVAQLVARNLVSDSIAAARLDTAPGSVNIHCDLADCSQLLPNQVLNVVHVHIGLVLEDPIFSNGFQTYVAAPRSYFYDARARYAY